MTDFSIHTIHPCERYLLYQFLNIALFNFGKSLFYVAMNNAITWLNIFAVFVQNEATATDQKVLCCCCCASDPIIATVKLPRTGYVPGEVINFNAEIDNRSDRTMNCTKAKLVMVSST